MNKKKCPKCNAQYESLSNYCSECGIELIQDDNRCSANKHTLCARITYKADDRYCAYCGSLTTYEVEREKNRAIIEQANNN